MFKWTKLGRILQTEDYRNGTWRMEFAQSPSCVMFDDFIRVYFCCRPLPIDGMYESYMAYADLDRRNPLHVLRVSDRPVMTLGALGTFDEFGVYPVSVIRTRHGLRVYYGGNTRCESVPFNAAIGVAESHDNGETFTRIGPGPVLSFGPGEPFVLGSPRVKYFDDRYFLWYAAGREWIEQDGRKQPVYKLRMATSSNGLDWERHGRDLLNNVLEENECQACGDVTFANGQYHMFFSYRYNFGYKAAGRGYRVGYAHSQDLVNWTRDDARAGLHSSAGQDWDSESVSYAHLFELDGTRYAFYQGNHMGKAGFGLARLDDDLEVNA